MTRSTSDPAAKRSVSFPGSLLAAAEKRAKSLGYNLSGYIQHLMRADVMSRAPGLLRVAEEESRYASDPVAKLSKAAQKFNKTKKRQATRKRAA